MRYTTAQIRLIRQGLQEFVDPDGEWVEVFRLASDELEEAGVEVFCSYLDAVGGPGRLLTAEEFQGAHKAFRGGAFGDPDYAAYEHLAKEIGHSHAELVSPFMDWRKYHDEKYPHRLVEVDGMHYEFNQAVNE
jgi:hypothetical protein